MSVSVRDFLKNRRDRALGSILGHAERSTWWKNMPDAERRLLRNAVIDALNGYHDCVLDLMKSDDGTRNEAVIELLERIDRSVRRDGRTTQQPG